MASTLLPVHPLPPAGCGSGRIWGRSRSGGHGTRGRGGTRRRWSAARSRQRCSNEDRSSGLARWSRRGPAPRCQDSVDGDLHCGAQGESGNPVPAGGRGCEVAVFCLVASNCRKRSTCSNSIELDTAPDELGRHRLGLRAARPNRLDLVSRSTKRLMARMNAAAGTANMKVLLHPTTCSWWQVPADAVCPRPPKSTRMNIVLAVRTSAPRRQPTTSARASKITAPASCGEQAGSRTALHARSSRGRDHSRHSSSATVAPPTLR